MKQILSVGLFVLITLAFSGFASASYVTDTIHHTVSYGSGVHDLESSSVTHYSTNHIRFHYQAIEQKWNSKTKHWQTTFTTNYYRDYKKTSSNKIIENNYWIQQGKYYFDSKFTKKTTVTPYTLFKKERGNNKIVTSIITMS
jgi:hypothetical protein